jgi:hypothetical protein
MIYKVLHRKLNIDQHEPHTKQTRSELKCSVGQAVPVPLVAEVVLLLLKTCDKSWKRKEGRNCDHQEWTMSVVICDIRSDGFNLITRKPWFSSFPVSTNLLYTTYRCIRFIIFIFTRGTYKINKACITFVFFPLGSVNIKLKVIPETRRAHKFDIYICITIIGSIHMVMDY